MKISYDSQKRTQTLDERGLDFDDAVQVFAGQTADVLDDRKDYGEPRYQSFGMLGGRLVTLVFGVDAKRRHTACHLDEKGQ